MESHLRITLLISATWLMMSAVTLKSMVEAQASIGPGLGSGDGDMSDILMPEETVSPSITDASSLMTMVTTSIMQISATSSSTADILILSPSTAEAQAVTSTTPISPATTSRDILPSTTVSSAAVNQSVTTLLPTLTSATMLPVNSSSILNTGIETTTIFEDRVITSSMEIFSTFTSTPLTLSATPIPTTTLLSTSVPTSTPLPITTTMDMITVPTTEPDETGTIASDSSTTAGEGDSTSTSAVDPVDDTRKSVPLSTVNIVIIVIVVVVVLIVVFVIVSCVLAGLLCKRNKKQDPVKREILSNWELQEPPKHGGARLMKIRTLDSMEEIDTAANGIEGSDREQRYQDPSVVVGQNVSETSNGGNNTAVTFGVPVVVDKTVGKTGETVPESKQQNGSRSETLDNDRGVQNGIKDSANGLKENKVSVVAEAPSTIKETTLTTSTSTFGPAPSLSLNEVEQKPLKTDANDESGAAAIKEMDKQNLVPAKEDAGKAFGAHGLFQDFHEVSTQL